MLDLGWTEMLVVVVVAILVIGPKDLPRALRSLGRWVGKARAVAREFQSSVDEMIRESELDDLRRQAESAGRVDLSDVPRRGEDPTGGRQGKFEGPRLAATKDEEASPQPAGEEGEPADEAEPPDDAAQPEPGRPAKLPR